MTGGPRQLPVLFRPPRPRTGTPPGVLLVSAPVTPPWTNASAILARDLAAHGRAYRYRVLGLRGQSSPGGTAQVEPIYSDGAGAFATARGDQLRLAARLVRPDTCAIHHFIFTPQPRTARFARLALAVSRKRSVHTVPSQPRATGPLADLMFCARVVAVSHATALLLRSAGVADVHVIRPAVAVPAAPPSRDEARARLALLFRDAAARQAPTFLYAGDLEFSDGATVFLDAAARVRDLHPEARFLIAWRPKTAAHQLAYRQLERRAAAAGLTGSVTLIGQVPDMGTLLSAVDAVVLAVDSLYAKLDIPLVLLEAMARGRPLVVSDLPSLGELAGLGEGTRVVRRSDPDALARALGALAGDPAAAARLGARARETAAACFSPERMVLAYEALYDELLDG